MKKTRLITSAVSLLLAGVLCVGLVACGGGKSVESVTLDKHTLRLEVGETATLTATVEPANAKNKSVSWHSFDESVASVSNGIVTALNAGSSTIEVKTSDGEMTDYCTVYVSMSAKDMGDVDWQMACYDTVSAQQYHLNVLQRGSYNNSIFTTVEIENKYDDHHGTLYSYRKIASDDFNPSSPTYDETKLYLSYHGETAVMYQHSGVRWTKINAPAGDSSDYYELLNEFRDLKRLSSIEVGESEDDWPVGIENAFSLFTYNESKDVFEAHLYVNDGMYFEGYADITVAIQSGRITEMTISGEDDMGIVYDTVYTVSYDEDLSIPDEVISEATQPIAPGALTQEEWEAAFAKTTASNANFTMTYLEAPDATPVVAKVAADKRMMYISDTGYGDEGYILTKDGVTGSFSYEDGEWSDGQYMYPKAFEIGIANYEYCESFMDYSFSYIMGLGAMLYGYVTYSGGVYTLDLSSFGASGMIPVDFEFNADKTLKSVKLEGIVDGEGLLMTVTFSDYGSTTVTPPNDSYVMPEAPSLTEAEWDAIFADMTDAENANFTVVTYSYGDYYTVKVDAANGIFAILGDEYEYYFILDENGTAGGRFTYYKYNNSWGDTYMMTAEDFADYIEGFTYPEVSLYFLSQLKNAFDYAVGFNNGTYQFEYQDESFSATVENGELVSARSNRYGYRADFSDRGTTEITVPAGRPDMPKAMEKSAFDSAMEATKNAKVYSLNYSDDENNYYLYYDGENYQALISVYHYSTSASTYYLIRVEGDKVVTYTKIDEAMDQIEQTCSSAAAAQEAWLAAVKDMITVLADVFSEEFTVIAEGEVVSVTVESMYSAIEWNNETYGNFLLVEEYTQFSSIHFNEGKLSGIFGYNFYYDAENVRMNIEWMMDDFGLND